VEREQGSGSGWASTPGRKVTPEEVQSKEFGSARLRVGYVMHEVDEFLDQVTDTLTALLAENERLRAERSDAGLSSPAPQRAAAPADATDRAAVEAFLQREKAFLQDLGALVQTHAEQLKSMVRSARSAPPVATATAAAEPAVVETEPPVQPEAQDPPAATPLAVEPAAGPPIPEEPAAATEPPSPGPVQPAEQPEERGHANDDVDAILDGSDDTGALTPVEAEEPIRIDEPEPARSRRSDDGEESSLRELFWGEE
jgi:DivIVA domain-containing protein